MEYTKTLQDSLTDAITQMLPIEDIKKLISSGAKINEPEAHGFRPIHFAAFRGYLEAVRLLIDLKADINVRNVCGYSPLHLAVEQGFLEIVKLLLESGATVNFYINTEDTANCGQPLHLAIGNKHLEISRMLLQYGANPNEKYFFGTEINLVSDIQFLELLLSFGADPNSVDNYGFTPIMKAVRYSHGRETAAILVKYGADVNAKANAQNDHRRVLHYAVLSENYDIVDLVVQNGAQMNYFEESDAQKASPLDLAVLMGHSDIVHLLIQSGADVNYRSPIMRSPLHVACTDGLSTQFEIFQMLLKAGADLRVFDQDGSKPILVEYLANNNSPNLEIINLLRKYGAEFPPFVNMADWSSVDKNCDAIVAEIDLEERVLSLQELSRLFLWRFLGGYKLMTSVEKFELPKNLQKYLLFDSDM